MPIKDFIIFIIAIAVIIKSADLFTSGASALAQVLRIPRMIIGLTIVSLATSAPEFSVSTISSSMGLGGMAVGNALGSDIANIGLVLGLAAMVRSIHFQPKLIKLELKFLLGTILFLFLLMLDFRRGLGGIFQEGNLGFGDGLLLSILLIGSFIYIVRRELRRRRETIKDSAPSPGMRRALLKFLLGALGVIAAAKYGIVPSGISIANFLGVTQGSYRSLPGSGRNLAPGAIYGFDGGVQGNGGYSRRECNRRQYLEHPLGLGHILSH